VATPASDAHTQADREFHEATAHLYDSTLMPIFGVYHDVVIGRLLDDLSVRAPGREAIDIGCGTAGITIELTRRGFAVRGLDHSPAMLALAREKLAREAPGADVELSVGDIRELPFGDGEFHLLTCQGVLHHLEETPATIREFARVLAPGGVFYLAEPCLGSNLALRTWQRARSALGPRGAPVETGAPAAVLEHDEGPIDQEQLLAAARTAGLDPRVEYWSQFEGMERLPRALHGLVLRALTRPWRRRSGNMIFVTGTKRP